MLHKIYAGIFLLVSVGLTATMSTAFMTFAFIVGTPMALTGSKYWFHVWLGFDKLCNAALGGDHHETISSRLGKSTVYGHDPVFGHTRADHMVAWLLDQVDPGHCETSIDWRHGEGMIDDTVRIAA